MQFQGRLLENNNTKHGIEVLAAAYLALNEAGAGSSPADPTGRSKDLSYSGKYSSLVRRRPRFESELVLSIFDNLQRQNRVHGVVVARYFAKVEVRDRNPLDAYICAWGSLASREPRAFESAGSNPAAQTRAF